MARMKLITAACLEMSEAFIEVERLERQMVLAMADNQIDADEVREIAAQIAVVHRETLEALAVAEKANEVEQAYDFHRTVGLDRPLHQYLRQNARDVNTLMARAFCGTPVPRAGPRLIGRASKSGLSMTLQTASDTSKLGR